MKVRIGIDLGGSFIKAGIIDDKYKVLYRLEVPSEGEAGARAVIKNLQNVYQTLTEIGSKRNYRITSLGIGSPGTISQPTGKVTDASPNIKDWKGIVLTRIFGKKGISVYADNDANCVALGEYLSGFKCRHKDMVFVTVGTGIGGGLIINGRLHRGATFAASEIGHMTIRSHGRLCKCGMRGCLEAYASVPNMMKRFYWWSKKYNIKVKKGISPVGLYNLYKKRNKAAIKTIEENADYLGIGLGSIVNILNPRVVVIGGGFSHAGNEYIRLLKESISKHAFKSAVSQLKVYRARLGNNAGFIGASLLALVDKDGQIKKTK